MPIDTHSTPQFAICNELFEGWSLADTAAFVAELGYQGLELAPFTFCHLVTDLSSADRSHIRRTVEGAGLRVVGLHWLLAKTSGLQLNDPDPAVRERTARYLLDLIDCCADLGGEVLIFGSPQQRDIPPGRSRTDAWASTVEIMRRCGQRALVQGVTFCIEPLSTQETNFIVSVDEAAELVRQVAHPGLQMMVDVKAMSQDSRPIPEQIRAAHPHFQHVHVNDPNLRGPGMGALDFRPIMQTLQTLNYTRWISVEVFDFTPGAEETARQSLDYLREFQT